MKYLQQFKTIALVLNLLKAFLILNIKTIKSEDVQVPELVAEFVNFKYNWKNDEDEKIALENGNYIIKNNILAGVKYYKNEYYLTIPRWVSGVPFTLNKLDQKTNLLTPYPNYNQVIGNCKHLQYVQSMEIDPFGIMWVIDVGRTAIFEDEPNNTCPPKLIRIDLNKDEILSSYVFPDSVASHTSNFINDIVVDVENEIAYISDAGDGRLIIYDHKQQQSAKFEDVPTTQANSSAFITIQGTNYYNDNITTPADGIALSGDGNTLFYCALQGTHTYSLKTQVFRDMLRGDATEEDVRNTIVDIGFKNLISDGMTMDCDENLYYGGLDTDALYSYNIKSNKNHIDGATTIFHDKKTHRWVDTFAWDSENGYLIYTTNRLDRFFFSDFSGALDFSSFSKDANFRVYRVKVGTYNYMECNKRAIKEEDDNQILPYFVCTEFCQEIGFYPMEICDKRCENEEFAECIALCAQSDDSDVNYDFRECDLKCTSRPYSTK